MIKKNSFGSKYSNTMMMMIIMMIMMIMIVIVIVMIMMLIQKYKYVCSNCSRNTCV